MAPQPAHPQLHHGCLANPPPLPWLSSPAKPSRPGPPHQLHQARDGVHDGAAVFLAVEVPLDHDQLSQWILQSREKEQGDATDTDKKGRRSVRSDSLNSFKIN